jgi:hypothetical protein
VIARAPGSYDSAQVAAAPAAGPPDELPARGAAAQQPELDLERVADQVYRRLVGRLRSESERRGR